MTPTTPRQVADRYVDAVCDLDPIVATSLGTRPVTTLPDPSPAGLEAEAALTRETLAELDRVLAADPSLADDPLERNCARLLRERARVPSWRRTRPARATARCPTCSARCTRSARSSP
jgi:hypothetical protein